MGLLCLYHVSMTNTKYYDAEASKYSKISLEGEGTLYLSFRDLRMLMENHFRSGFSRVKAIDYGCGAGRSTRYLKSIHVGQVDGFDISYKMIQEAKSCDPCGSYTEIESGGVPKVEASYDLGFMSFVTNAVESEKELKDIFKELYRVIKPGGQLLSLSLSETFYHPANQWISYLQDYPENHSLTNGKQVRLKITPIDFEIRNTYWLENVLIEYASQAGFSLMCKHGTLGKKEDEIDWKDEWKSNPYTIFSFRKE